MPGVPPAQHPAARDWERPPADADGAGGPWLASDPSDPSLSRVVVGLDERGGRAPTRVVRERPLTIFLGDREVVTAMTVGDHPEYLALGWLFNQGLLDGSERGCEVEHDAELDVVVARARGREGAALDGRRVRTSGCAEGTVFEAFMEETAGVRLPEGAPLRTSELYALLAAAARMPSLYLEAGAIHGCVLARGARPLLFFEDVGRHNAVDKTAGYMLRHAVAGDDKTLYTTGRLTSEMVLKAARMGVPAVVSRSGFTERGVSLARRAGMTLIGRARGERFTVLSGGRRVVRDAPVRSRPSARGPGRRGGAGAAPDDAAEAAEGAR